MGIVSDYLATIIERQRANGLVVWFDPERTYETFARSLPDVIVFDGSFFAIRAALDPLLEGEASPHVVVYVPMSQEQTHYALVTLTSVGVVLRPGELSQARNTRLSVIARGALRGKLNEVQLAEISKQCDSRVLTLADLDQLSADIPAPGSEVLRLIFGTPAIDQIALTFLVADHHDRDILARDAQEDLFKIFAATYGCAIADASSLPEARRNFARHLLVTDMLATLGDPPAQFAGLRGATDARQQTHCCRLAAAWRQQRQYTDRYIATADEIEADLLPGSLNLTVAQARDCATFGAITAALQTAIERDLDQASPEAQNDLLVLARMRLEDSIWSAHDAIRARWQLILIAGQLLSRAESITRTLRPATATTADLIASYTEGEQPWCEMDTFARHLTYQVQRFDSQIPPTLELLIAKAKRSYTEAGGMLAEHFAQAYQTDQWLTAPIRQQRDIFARQVAPAVRAGRTAYVLVDALRFEMARELMLAKRQQFHITLTPALASVPTITPIGMASLLPGADRDAQIVALPSGGLALQIGSEILDSRQKRMAWLRAHVDLDAGSMIDLTLEDVVSRRESKKLKQAHFAVITSQEIDQSGETDNIIIAGQVNQHMIETLGRAINLLNQYGYQTILIVTDHGYLAGDELTDAMKIPPPGGDTISLHRRYWVGRGGAQNDAHLRVPFSQFHGPPDLDIAMPWGWGGFAAPGGASRYFHGGIAPQEIIIPVLAVSCSPTLTSHSAAIAWSVVPRSTQITSRVLTVTIHGQPQGLFTTELPRLRLEIWHGQHNIAQLIPDDSHADATGEIQLRYAPGENLQIEPLTVALQIVKDPPSGAALTLHVLDALTNRDLVIPAPILTWAAAY